MNSLAAVRRSISAFALAALAAGALAGPARAEEEPLPVSVTGPDSVNLSLHPEPGEPGEPGEPQIELGLRAPGEPVPDENGVTYPIHQGEYTVTVDASSLAGVAAVNFSRLGGWQGCSVEGLVATCRGYEIYAGRDYNDLGGIRLDVTDESAAGEVGSIEVTAAGEGLAFTGHTVDVLVGGPELQNKQLAEPEGFKAGDTFQAPLGFRNVGGLGGKGVVLRVSGTRGLSLPGTFGNCWYDPRDPADLRGWSTALCVFDSEFAAGAAYGLSTPFPIGTAGFALYDSMSYSFSAVPADQVADLLAEGDYRAGSGPDLELVRLPDADPAGYTRYAEMDFPTKNTFDLDLTGERLRARKGQTVPVDIGFANHGPAWLALLRSGGEPISFWVDLPPGTTATTAPEACRAAGWEGAEGDYLCNIDTPILEDASLTFTFALRVDEVIRNATGRAFFTYTMPNEGNPANDSGAIVLNPRGRP
ncbi:hypothetical protein TUSST3_43900 [Streptomyces sp. TUS-ST3]|uniref:hypothetical protein n=1 Tax=Streptomyces sp. TUS-ST3 TaxID=3025591 RepID=UPI00235B327B|nr:hypothetical protein [Streptomyces sp. TUS-ST3]GLP67768.1 hypothetical protein TUSST3_43900 [Streptomyces sp. TUS-ST3]